MKYQTALVGLTLAILVGLSCGGSSRLSVQEYAVACAEIGDRIEKAEAELVSVAQLPNVYTVSENALADFKELNPPKELEDFHEVNVQSMTALQEVMDKYDLPRLARDLERSYQSGSSVVDERIVRELGLFEAELERTTLRFGSELNRVVNELPSRIRDILEDAGC